MVERLILAAVLIGIGFAVYCLQRRFHLLKLAQNVHIDPILADMNRGIATIVYFTTPMCIPCKTQQQPALRKLQTELGDNVIQIIEIDATEDMSAAERWGVLSAPTTFVLDESFQPVHVNHGVADVKKLKQQLGIVAA